MEDCYLAVQRLINRCNRAVSFSQEGLHQFEEGFLQLQVALQASGDPRGPHVSVLITKALEGYKALPRASGVEQPPDRLYSMPLSVLRLYQQPAELVRNILRRGEVCIISGPPKARKTWTAYDLVLSAVHGLEWMGQWQCQPCKVLYVDMELQEGSIASRLDNMQKHHKYDKCQPVQDDQFHVFSGRASQRGLRDLKEAVRLLTNTVWDFQAELVVIDTVSAFLPLEDENSNAEVNDAMGYLMAMATQTQAGLVLVHHTPKSAGERTVTDAAAGAGAFTRRPDTVIAMTVEEEPATPEHPAETRFYCQFRFRSHAPLERHRIDWSQPVVGRGLPHSVPVATADAKISEPRKRK